MTSLPYPSLVEPPPGSGAHAVVRDDASGSPQDKPRPAASGAPVAVLPDAQAPSTGHPAVPPAVTVVVTVRVDGRAPAETAELLEAVRRLAELATVAQPAEPPAPAVPAKRAAASPPPERIAAVRPLRPWHGHARVPAPPTGVHIDLASHVATRDGVPVRLARREFALLAFLAEHPRQVFSRAQLLNRVWRHQVWDYDARSGERTVDVHVRRIRQKLGEDLRLIETVRGIGYRLDAAVSMSGGDEQRTA